MRSRKLLFFSTVFLMSIVAIVSGFIHGTVPLTLPQPRTTHQVQSVPYDEIRKISERAVAGKIVIPAYVGGPQDFGYLKKYITKFAADIYGVDSSIFETPTLLSTSLLRDLVHKANWQTPLSLNHRDLVKTNKVLYPVRTDIAEMWRYPSYGVCGHMTWSLYNIFKSLGYAVDRIDTVNGRAHGYTDSHVTIQVFLYDVKKFILQDPTFNYLIQDDAGNFLDFYEARRALPAIEFNSFAYILDMRFTKKNYLKVPKKKMNEIRDFYFLNIYTFTAFREGREYKQSLANLGDRFMIGDDLWMIVTREDGSIYSENKNDGRKVEGDFQDMLIRAVKEKNDRDYGVLNTRISIDQKESGWSAFVF